MRSVGRTRALTSILLVAGLFVLPLPALAQPSLSVDPTKGQAGISLAVTGTGFGPGEGITLSWDGNLAVGSATADGNGGFDATVSTSGLGNGRHYLIASAGSGTARAPFNAVGPPDSTTTTTEPPSTTTTEPPTTQPPTTAPPTTEPPTTQPPTTAPPTTEPPTTQPPPSTEPPTTQPPPSTNPPSTSPPITRDPINDPTTTAPPETPSTTPGGSTTTTTGGGPTAPNPDGEPSTTVTTESGSSADEIEGREPTTTTIPPTTGPRSDPTPSTAPGQQAPQEPGPLEVEAFALRPASGPVGAGIRIEATFNRSPGTVQIVMGGRPLGDPVPGEADLSVRRTVPDVPPATYEVVLMVDDQPMARTEFTVLETSAAGVVASGPILFLGLVAVALGVGWSAAFWPRGPDRAPLGATDAMYAWLARRREGR